MGSVDGLNNLTAHFMNRTNNRLESIKPEIEKCYYASLRYDNVFLHLMKCLSLMSTERDHTPGTLCPLLLSESDTVNCIELMRVEQLY